MALDIGLSVGIEKQAAIILICKFVTAGINPEVAGECLSEVEKAASEGDVDRIYKVVENFSKVGVKFMIENLNN